MAFHQILVSAYVLMFVASSSLLERLDTFLVGHVEPGHQLGNSQESKHHPQRTSLSFHAFNRFFKIELEKNSDLISEKYQEREVRYRSGVKVGERVTRTAQDVEHCYYRGVVHKDDSLSRISFSTCNGGFRGSVNVDGMTIMLEPAYLHLSDEDLRLKQMSAPTLSSVPHIVYQLSDMPHEESTCGEGRESVERHDDEHRLNGAHVFQHVTQVRRDDKLFEKIALGVNRQLQSSSQQNNFYVELFVANDYRRFQLLGAGVPADTLDICNRVSAIYENTLRFARSTSITLVDQVTFTEEDPWEADLPRGTCANCAADEVSVDTLLAEWHAWRTAPGNAPANDNGHLFSGHDFESSVVGYAGMSAMCISQSSGGVEMALSDPQTSAAIVAHEMGHNFGFSHDSVGNTCANTGYIMNAVMSVVPDTFSNCSVAYMDDFVALGRTCLDDAPTTAWTDVPVCGNGFRESGEECDCGQTDCSLTRDPCCHGATCRLNSWANCSADDGCCESCDILAQGVTCRDAEGDCDIAEECNGVESTCPENHFRGAGFDCSLDSSSGKCYSGNCVTFDSMCAVAFARIENDGQPWVECNMRLELQSNECGTLFCETAQGVCNSIEYSANLDVQVSNGAPCSQGQCLNGECVASSELNPYNRWQPAPWADCYSCDDWQTRDVWCRGVNPYTGEAFGVQEELCSPLDLETLRLCENATLGCVVTDDSIMSMLRSYYIVFNGQAISEWLYNSLPRICGPEYLPIIDPSSSGDIEAEQLTYFQCTAYSMLPGILLFLAFLLFFCFELCCTCRNKACCKADPERNYSKLSNAIFFMLYLLLGTAMCALAIIGMFFNQEMSRAITSEEYGVVDLSYALLDTTVTMAEDISYPLAVMAQLDLNTSAALLDVVSYTLEHGTDGTVTALDDLAASLAAAAVIRVPARGDGTYTSPSLDLQCSFCGSMSTAVTAASNFAVNRGYSIAS